MIEHLHPTISVVIPTFNRASLIANAIESVLSQTYKPHEIIVVDDGSTDDTAEKLKPYMGSIRYFHQENRGASAAQNKGIELATGEWVSILASDDLWMPTKLEQQVKALNEMGPEFGACFTDCSFFGSPKWNVTAFEQAGLTTGQEMGPLLDPFKCILAKYAAIYFQSLLVRRSLLQELGRFDERMVVAEDTDLIFRMAFKTRFCFVNVPLVKIDRTESRGVGLMELFAGRNENVFRSLELMYRKWLNLPELSDAALRSEIGGHFRGLYFNWIIAKLHQSNYREAFGKMQQQRQLGVGYGRILATLIFRAGRRLCSALRR